MSREFTIQLDLNAPRAAVWRALTEAQEIVRWFAPHAEVNPGPGGTVVWEWDGHHTWKNEILSWQPEEHLRLSYPFDLGNDKVPLFIDFQLNGDGGQTTLRVVHSEFGDEADFDQEYDGVSSGWTMELSALRHYLEEQLGKDRELFTVRVRSAGDQASLWQAMLGPHGIADDKAFDGLGVGDPYAIRFSDETPMQGSIRCRLSESEITASVDNLDGGLFRAHSFDMDGASWIWLALATYGTPTDTVQRYKQAMQDTARRLVEAGAATETT